METTESIEPSKGKKKSKKRASGSKKGKTKPSPVMKVDEETLLSNSLLSNDNTTPEFPSSDASPSTFSSTNASPIEDDSYFLHLVLTAVLNQKKMELLESEEVMEVLLAKRVKRRESLSLN